MPVCHQVEVEVPEVPALKQEQEGEEGGGRRGGRGARGLGQLAEAGAIVGGAMLRVSMRVPSGMLER
jgi:hypothetical protein